MNDYEIRKQEKIDRFRELADKNKALVESKLNQAHQMAETIPFGQPILVGHYSEKRDRNFRERIDNTVRKGFELKEKAEYYADKAATAESNTAISSDDPEAVTKLKEKIAEAEAKQEKMRAFNKCLRAKDNEGMLALGYSQPEIDKLSTPGFCNMTGYLPFELTNNNANIRRMKERLTILEKHVNDKTTERMFGDIKIIDNVEANRLQIFFPGKPSDAIREALKHSGFRWSPTEGSWQRQRSNSAIWEVKNIMGKITNGELK